jgi:hypothetical protein
VPGGVAEGVLEQHANVLAERARVRDRAAAGLLLEVRELLAELGVVLGAGRELRQARAEVTGHLVGQDGAQRGDADGASERAEERDHRGRGTHVGLRGVVLHREDAVSPEATAATAARTATGTVEPTETMRTTEMSEEVTRR